MSGPNTARYQGNAPMNLLEMFISWIATGQTTMPNPFLTDEAYADITGINQAISGYVSTLRSQQDLEKFLQEKFGFSAATAQQVQTMKRQREHAC